MRIKNFFLLFIALLILSTTFTLWAQERTRLIILSQRIGPEINREQRDYYRLFQRIKNFQKASFLERILGTDTTYWARVVFATSEGELRDTLLKYSRNRLFLMSGQINYFEDLVAGKYIMGSEIYSFQPKDGTNANILEVVGKYDPSVDILPFSSNEIIMDTPVSFGFSFGLSSYNPDFGALRSVVQAIENNYQRQGYPITRQEPTVDISSLTWFALRLRFKGGIETVFEIGQGRNKDALTVRALSVTVLYSLSLTENKMVCMCFGGGIGRYSFLCDQSLAYDNRIGPFDNYGGYDKLSAIELKGGITQIGFPVTCGIKIISPETKYQAGVIFGVSYLIIPPLEIKTKENISTEVHLNSVIFSASIVFYL